ncbi:enoyl-CoA hydratase [Oleiphilus messinensis]|uniref:Enoyl-CoA hydratase n=1 Tax=Oleiphilus messinensis TaxID=141451 RepID=A0A1Y0I5T8_9GAMM|nr:enoyl-CoA hydratase/isomerase family protein [Oleiphilus messinensis]ARU55842.1 enoyl-CoA hydratase [Oleiphilus messinensis]
MSTTDISHDNSVFDNLNTLQASLEQGVLHITLNRPKARNAMSLEMVKELSTLFATAEQRPDLRAIVLRGAAGHFCAGGDIKDMASARGSSPKRDDGTEDPFFTLNRAFGRMLCQVQSARQVVVVITEGATLGGGFGLACVSDVAITAADAQFGLPETGLGLPPAQIAPFVVKRIGLTQARRLALLGARFDGQEAQRLGIAHYVCASDQEIAETLTTVLSQIKRCAPDANAMTKMLLLNTLESPLESVLDLGAEQFAQAARSPEATEGAMAFIQKRQPKWAE